MLELTTILDKKRSPDGYLTLPIEQRMRSRLRVKLDDGREAGLFLPRGNLLRSGDQLGNESVIVIEIIAAAEKVTTVYCTEPAVLARAAYHLGNRHIALQVEDGWLRFQYDHVLNGMLQQMGLVPVVEQAPFEPEAGAYQQIADTHTHGHRSSSKHQHLD